MWGRYYKTSSTTSLVQVKSSIIAILCRRSKVQSSTWTAGNASPRRAAATAGCAGSPGILAKAELKRTEHVAGSQSWSKIGQNGEYWPPAILMIQSIHLEDAVLGPVHALLRSLLCLPLLLSTVHNFCAYWRLCSSRATNTTASLIAPSFIVRRRHGSPSTAALTCEL